MKHLLPSSLILLTLATPALAQSVTFSPAVAYASGGRAPSSVVVRDLNGDGKPDLVLSNASSSTLGVLLGTGTGTFPAMATTYPSGTTNGDVNTVAVGDVNADGKPDLVALNGTDSTVGVLLGTGTGTFGTAATYSVGSSTYPSGLALADLNGDGRADMLVANNLTSAIGVLLSRSTGGLGAATQLPTSDRPQSLATGDMNGDGKPDLVVGTVAGDLLVLLGSGTGTLAPPSAAYPSGGTSVQQVRLGDVNGDGQLDVVTANTFENTVSVLLGTGTGALGAAISYVAGSDSAPSSVALGDVNRDGRLDLATANYARNSAGVLLGQAAGGFVTPATQFSTGSNSAPQDVAVADVNGDGRPDLVTANSTTATVAVLLNTSVALAARSPQLAAGVQLAPNPTRGDFEVQVPALAGGATTVRVELRSVLGQSVRQLSAPLPAAGAHLTIPAAGLAPGVYLLRLQAGEDTLVRRVVVE